MKITKIKEDITTEIASSFKNSIAIDTEATGLQIPERDKLSLCLLYTSPSPRDVEESRMPSSA